MSEDNATENISPSDIVAELATSTDKSSAIDGTYSDHSGTTSLPTPQAPLLTEAAATQVSSGCCGGTNHSAPDGLATVCEHPEATASLSEEAAAPDELTLLNALKQVIDPELMINIVDLGLVYSVQQEDRIVSVDMTLTSPACPAGPQIIQQSRTALENVAGVKQATIKLVMSPPWTPDRMTDEARDQLGIF